MPSGKSDSHISKCNMRSVVRLVKMLDCIRFSDFWKANQFSSNNVMALKAIEAKFDEVLVLQARGITEGPEQVF